MTPLPMSLVNCQRNAVPTVPQPLALSPSDVVVRRPASLVNQLSHGLFVSFVLTCQDSWVCQLKLLCETVNVLTGDYAIQCRLDGGRWSMCQALRLVISGKPVCLVSLDETREECFAEDGPRSDDTPPTKGGHEAIEFRLLCGLPWNLHAQAEKLE